MEGQQQQSSDLTKKENSADQVDIAAPVKAEKLVKLFKTHQCALDFDHSFCKATYTKQIVKIKMIFILTHREFLWLLKFYAFCAFLCEIAEWHKMSTENRDNVETLKKIV